jgi:RNA polymerase sigma factor (sigma-70 family)
MSGNTAHDQEVNRRVEAHRRLVDFVVSRYVRRHDVRGIERDDLVSWGLLGLVHAARAWDPGRGLAFSTLAVPAIERTIARGMRAEHRARGGLAMLSLDALLDGDPGAEGCSASHLEQLRDDGDNVEERIVQMETRMVLRQALADLSPEQQWVVEQRFFRNRTLREIAHEAGTSRQAIHLREQNILRTLRRKLDAALRPAA